MTPPKNSIRLLQFTDTHLYGDAAGELRGVATYPALRAAIKHAKTHHWPCDGMLVTGDLVQDDASGYARFKEVFGELGVPVYCIPGNHDEPAQMLQELQDKPYQLNGVVQWPGWFAVMLDSYLPRKASGRLSAESLQALDKALTENAHLHGLVCLHHHPISMNSKWLDQVGLENAVEFFDVLDRHSNVRAVLWGHVHQIHDGVRNGVRLMSAPSTCAQFKPQSDNFAIDHRPPGYRRLELLPNGEIQTDVIWLD